MFAEIITIGDEILMGQIVDTNSAFIAKRLNEIGVSVYQISSVQDELAHILQALREAEDRADLIIVTGGLGPTRDDITKQAICEYFQDTLVEDSAVLAHVETLFSKYLSTPISDINRMQALVPSRATVLMNKQGTAPGMWIRKGKKVFVSLPGVPMEMKELITGEVVPRVLKEFDRPFLLHRTLVTYGVGESAIAQKLEGWETALPSFIKLAYLPSLGKVRLRVTAKGPDKNPIIARVTEEVEKLYALIGDIVLGEEELGNVELLVGGLLLQKKRTLATAESFTGGAIASLITSVPGASAHFKGSVVSYATETKINVLGVKESTIAAHSVVSAEVAMEMAVRAKDLFKTDFAISTTGNAGPTKGDSEAEVGTVYIAIASPDGVYAQKSMMGNQRERITEKSVNKALELLYKEILKF
ncbi:MAG: competence/damage-inducible protein A [Sediminicola sp.]